MSLNAAAVSKPTVVDFSTAATAKHRSADTDTAHPDAALIKACINFAVAVRGASGAFEADPTDDNDFASKMDVVLLRRAEKQQALIVGLRPTTLDGLRAKSAVADMALTFDFCDRCWLCIPDGIRHRPATSDPASPRSVHRTGWSRC